VSARLIRARAALVLAALAIAGLPLAAAKITEYALPVGSVPVSIALGFDGKIWFTEHGRDKLAAITNAGTIFEFDAPTPGCGPYGLTLSPHDGRLWFTCAEIAKIGVIGLGPSLLDFDVASIPRGPITSGPEGDVWLATRDDRVRAFAVNGTEISSSGPGPGSPGPDPFAGASGGDGGVWFVTNTTDYVYRFSIESNGVISFSRKVVPGAGPYAAAWCSLANGAPASLWFTERTAGKLARYNPLIDLSPQEILLPSGAASVVNGIACGGDGSVWYAAPGINKIGRLKPDGATFEEFSLPTPSAGPRYLAVAPDGSVWFTEIGADRIGRLQLRAPGDLNDDGAVDVADVFYLINFLFAGGPAPVP
jgi:virginiamycin B lyase